VPVGEAVQEGAQHRQDEEFKAEELEVETKEQKSSHDKQALCLIDNMYENPQKASGAQLDALISHFGKKVSAEGMQLSAAALNRLGADFRSIRHDQGLVSSVQSQGGAEAFIPSSEGDSFQ
jgi:hypothetical protein